MDLITAQRIVDDWNKNYWEGRVKTQTVIAAEDCIQGKKPRVITIEERHKKIYKKKSNEAQSTKRRAKQLRRFLVQNTGNSNDGTWNTNISSASYLDVIPNKSFRAIVEVVAGTYNFNIRELMGESRNSDLVLARMIIIYLAAFKNVGTLEFIGRLIRRIELPPMDHSTVIHARDTISDRIRKEVKMKCLIYELKEHVEKKLTIETLNFNSFE